MKREEAGVTIKGQDEEGLSGDGIDLYLSCGGGSINLYM